MKDMQNANSWIDSLTSTKELINLGFAIQDALNIFNECEDVYIIIKGAPLPFTTSNKGQNVTIMNQFIRDNYKKELISWTIIKRNYPKVKFNIISLDKNINEENEMELCCMSSIGNGFYNCTKNN